MSIIMSPDYVQDLDVLQLIDNVVNATHPSQVFLIKQGVMFSLFSVLIGKTTFSHGECHQQP